MLQLNKKDIIEIIEYGAVLSVCASMYAYGFGKYFQFGNAAKIATPISEATGMQLMWAFYGYSLPFALFLGAMEVLGGTLLLFHKTRIIGCLLLTGVLSNIIIQDIVFEINEGALYAAIIYQSLILIILFIRHKPLIDGIKVLSAIHWAKKGNKSLVIKILLVLLVAFLFKALEFYLSH